MKDREYYKTHIDEFAEDVLGIELYDYQKQFLKMFDLTDNRRYVVMHPYRNGKRLMTNIFNQIDNALKEDVEVRENYDSEWLEF